MKTIKMYDELVEAVITQIKEDVHGKDVSALTELLVNCSIDALIDYLPEDIGKEFK